MDYNKEFIKSFNKLTHKHHPHTAWTDFVTMAACAISNRVDANHFKEREQLYLDLIGKYDTVEQKLFPELLATTVKALQENTDQDFLGSLYMQLEISNDKLGQFFTPYSISQMMGEIEATTAKKISKPIRICEPACGSGGLLIAFANALARQNVNYQENVFFTATDLDKTAALMCYIQMSFLGCAGVVTVGNTLTEEVFELWYTPMYFNDVWNIRRKVEATQNVLNSFEKCKPVSEKQKVKTLYDF